MIEMIHIMRCVNAWISIQRQNTQKEAAVSSQPAALQQQAEAPTSQMIRKSNVAHKTAEEEKIKQKIIILKGAGLITACQRNVGLNGALISEVIEAVTSCLDMERVKLNKATRQCTTQGETVV